MVLSVSSCIPDLQSSYLQDYRSIRNASGACLDVSNIPINSRILARALVFGEWLKGADTQRRFPPIARYHRAPNQNVVLHSTFLDAGVTIIVVLYGYSSASAVQTAAACI
ncbi:hypothetical protein GALMADRAFT_161204 [Galerina marginata CBS 339.88]|uniref:Uncharacterized protein n=1 Tax=Galerina marginata (strain CBS 339.88) TaxID=685588 RepID=A0A067SMW7_GALM3|nr:hypothetical protein GALMADRAFT_161204 [Galerina marginata CBS 339.88]